MYFVNNSFNSSSFQHLFEIQLQHLSFIGIFFFFFKKAYIEENCHLIRALFYNEYPVGDYVLTVSNSAYVLSFGRILEIIYWFVLKVHLLVLEGHMSPTESSVFLIYFCYHLTFSLLAFELCLHSSCFGFWYLVKPVGLALLLLLQACPCTQYIGNYFWAYSLPLIFINLFTLTVTIDLYGIISIYFLSIIIFYGPYPDIYEGIFFQSFILLL